MYKRRNKEISRTGIYKHETRERKIKGTCLIIMRE